MTAVQDQHCITQYLTPQVLIGSLNSDSINTLVEDLFAIFPPSLSLSLSLSQNTHPHKHQSLSLPLPNVFNTHFHSSISHFLYSYTYFSFGGLLPLIRVVAFLLTINNSKALCQLGLKRAVNPSTVGFQRGANS